MVKDKVNFRARGPMTQLTRQPVSGRANDGGLRIGEMERDSIISHGATEFLKESMLVRGDQYYMAVCNKTGGIAIYNPDRNIFMSPLADGPLKFVDSLDGTSTNVEHVTKYGRSFSVVKVPYVFKLFMQELQAINVKMAIITEDNVDQFDNMNFSRNISLLTSGKGLEEIKDLISSELNIENKDRMPSYQESSSEEEYKYVPNSMQPKSPSESPPSIPKSPSESPPRYAPNSPEYVPNSPEYVPNSPEYVPNSPEYVPPGSQIPGSSTPGSSQPGSSTPRYAPNSPVYAPNSPAYAPNSPVYSPPGSPPNSPPQYQLNEFVTFNADFKPNRVWRIVEFDRGYAVLETDDREGLTDTIKVAALSDIKRFSDGMGQRPNSIQAPEVQAQAQAPVVNVIVGDHNTMESTKQKQAVEEEEEGGDLDFSKPKIRMKESSDDAPNLMSNAKSIVVKKV